MTADGRRAQLHALLARPGVHVLLDRDAPILNRLALGPYVDVHRLDSTSGTGVVAVRPDGYVGFRGNSLDLEQLHAWLTRVGALPDAASMGHSAAKLAPCSFEASNARG